MSDLEKRDWKSYEKLAQVDFKCLEHEICKIIGNSAKIGKKKDVPEKYKFKCRREEDVNVVLDKLFKLIVPTGVGACDYIGECIEKRSKNKDIEKVKAEEGKECKKCKGYWFTTDETFKSYYDMWKEWKTDKNGMDPDDSDCESNPFLRAIYYSLWGKRIEVGDYIDENGDITEEKTNIYQHGFTRFRTSYLFPKMLWGGDTMNTLASYEDAINKSLKNNSTDINVLSRKCHQLGNFVLVPAYFNQWRGLNRSIKDQMDLSLYILSVLEDRQKQSNENNRDNNFIFSFNECFSTYWGRTKEVKEAGWEIVKNAFEGWDKSNFTNFINMFFLWDYVEIDKEKTDKEKTGYYVKNMKTGERINNKETVKVDEKNISQYIVNANKYIERRGIFMAAMLKIAVEYENGKIRGKDYEPKAEWEEWKVSDIYKYIVEKVFLTGETYSDYKDVFKAIKGALTKLNLKIQTKIFDEAQNLIENVKEDANDKKRSD